LPALAVNCKDDGRQLREFARGLMLDGSDEPRNLRMAVDRLRMKAIEIIGQECQDRILREFPSQWLPHTLEEILEAAKQGDRSAQKAWKLLQGGRFKK